MEIKDYQFGKLSINGNTIVNDVIVFPDHYQDSWRRAQGHVLQVEDLRAVIEFHPEVLVVGTGFYGRMQIPSDTRQFLTENDIKLVFAPTTQAVQEFNKLQKQCANIVAALHLTC